jgi:hypothetical protein
MTAEHPGTWAASIGQPWASAVALAGTLALDRMTWKPPEWATGLHLAIHAPRTQPDERWVGPLATILGCAPDALRAPLGAVVAVALLVEVEDVAAGGKLSRFSRWRFAHALRLPAPVPCAGQSGLFRLHPDDAARLLYQLPTGSPLA